MVAGRPARPAGARLTRLVLALGALVVVTALVVGYLWLRGGAPSGYRIAYVSDAEGDNLELYLGDHLGRRATRLTRTPEDELFPTWSPDGRRLAFLRTKDWLANTVRSWEDDEGLYLMTWQGREGQERLLLPAAHGGLGRPAWSPNGRYLAVIGAPEFRSGGRSDPMPLVIYDLRGNTFEMVPIDLMVDTLTCLPAWSPDGSALAFVGSETSGEARHPAPWVYLRDGAEPVRLAQRGESVAWSPSGRVVIAVGGGGGGLLAVDPQGGEPVPLGAPLGDETHIAELAWSPDGAHVAVTGLLQGEQGVLNILNERGEARYAHTLGAYTIPLNPSWSPDGRFVAFWTLRPMDLPPGAGIAVADAAEGTLAEWASAGGVVAMPAWRPGADPDDDSVALGEARS